MKLIGVSDTYSNTINLFLLWTPKYYFLYDLFDKAYGKPLLSSFFFCKPKTTLLLKKITNITRVNVTVTDTHLKWLMRSSPLRMSSLHLSSPILLTWASPGIAGTHAWLMQGSVHMISSYVDVLCMTSSPFISLF